jgi:hypothetical protein
LLIHNSKTNKQTEKLEKSTWRDEQTNKNSRFRNNRISVLV